MYSLKRITEAFANVGPPDDALMTILEKTGVCKFFSDEINPELLVALMGVSFKAGMIFKQNENNLDSE